MGEIAALLTSFCWAFSSIFFTAAGQRIGSLAVNRMRLLSATLLFLATHLAFTGRLLPLDAGGERWLWLVLSGLAGLVFGDTLLFQAFVYIGVRIPTLVMASVPVISAITAWAFLSERLELAVIAGIALAVAGISIVVLERSGQSETPKDRRRYLLGVLCALGGATGQALGLVLAKKGLAGDYPVLSGVLIRMLAGLAAIWLMALLSGQARATLQAFWSERQAMRSILCGTLIGPYIGVYLSLVAVQLTYVGIASTLMALAPIILLPIARWGYREQVSGRAVVGTLVSIAGVTIISLFS